VRGREERCHSYLAQNGDEFGDGVRAVLPLYDDEIRGPESLRRAAKELYA
jgi:hypothetical protein